MAHILHDPRKPVTVAYDAMEYCPECDHDIPVTIDEDCVNNLQAICPVCGRKLMLCTTLCECTVYCDWNETTGCCCMQCR